MQERDYIVKLIKEMVRTILKMLFNIDTENPTEDILDSVEAKDTLNELIAMIARGEINKAEDMVFDMESGDDRENLKVGLLFYSYLNEKENAFLEEHDFDRDEIRQGMKDLVTEYGLGDMTDIFLMN